ncbi:MAG: bacterial transferase hexapeptide family protein [Burkholderiaceae bacterium]|nr:bacterial transferase hexapeptide family protein [Burkholderiaceae bacterium]
MAIYRLGNHTPDIHPNAWIAPSADVIGNVRIEAGASVWFGVTIRADHERIVIGENSNIQDGSVLHADPGCPLLMGKNVTVGHQAMLHGCKIGDGAMVGIRATVLNGAVIGENALVGACALVTEGKEMASNALIIGSPARVARTMSEEDVHRMQGAARFYIKNSKLFAAELEQIG